MERPEIDLIKESLPFIDERIAKGTITHLIEYIEYKEEKMKSKRYTEVTITMTDAEAIWLKKLVQNSATENEAEEDKDIRGEFWKVLDREGI